MSEAKFTKGDWSIKETAPLACAWTFDFEKMNLGFSIEKDEFDANTSLIAAAPELYEMLASLLRHEIESVDTHNRVVDLLAKARGEQ